MEMFNMKPRNWTISMKYLFEKRQYFSGEISQSSLSLYLAPNTSPWCRSRPWWSSTWIDDLWRGLVLVPLLTAVQKLNIKYLPRPVVLQGQDRELARNVVMSLEVLDGQLTLSEIYFSETPPRHHGETPCQDKMLVLSSIASLDLEHFPAHCLLSLMISGMAERTLFQ